MKRDFTQRFGFLLSDVAKRYSEQFDRLAREHIGLSLAQCRLIGALGMHGDEVPMSQIELAHRLDLSAMAVAGLCDRMAAAGWIRRQVCATDRRVNEVHLEPRAEEALDAALSIGDVLYDRVLGGLTTDERTQLMVLLAKARSGLVNLSDGAQVPA